MKNVNDRVIAIDYFRGVCILAVIVNHAMFFSIPFAYLTGAGRQWTSAAEMLLLISGLTFGIVRADKIKTNFRYVVKKTYRRTAQIYLFNLIAVVASLFLAYFVTNHGLANGVDGNLPTQHGFALFWSIITLSYSIGWASFLACYTVFLAFAPFALYVLKTKFWSLVPATSIAIYLLNTYKPQLFGAHNYFAMWQIYFFLGLTLTKFRVQLLSKYYNLKLAYYRIASLTVLSVAALLLCLSVLFENNNILYPRIERLVSSGWLPAKLQVAYLHLLNYKPTVDHLLMDSRTGILRPVAALIFLAGIYLLYQNNKKYLLSKTGKIFNAAGQDTLWLFVSQAIAIPVLVTLPLQRNFINNTILTSTLLLSMWIVMQRNNIKTYLIDYGKQLKVSYMEAKLRYQQRYEDQDLPIQ